jgi:methyltransferase (TIGR00027 family)
MGVAYLRVLGDAGITSIPGFSDAPARRLLGGRFWSRMLAFADRLARNPGRRGRQKLVSAVDSVLLRVAFIDDAIARAACPQLVIPGAGLDTRAWRLEAQRGGRVFEVDHPATQAYKRKHARALGQPLCDLAFVTVDFEKDDLARALEAAHHDASVPTTWVWEGVIMYLDDAAFRGTLQAIRRRSAPGSLLLAHYHVPETRATESALRRAYFAWLGEPQLGLRTPETMRAEVERAGFRILEDAGIVEQAARVGGAVPRYPRAYLSRILVATVA